ncbi:MAG: hypothetical protein D3910_27255, partial [Candidatus Electrothrix sp. ATG2]|nr:hypothetical protein [Candidatus Electrothrix sp. ATG2]
HGKVPCNLRSKLDLFDDDKNDEDAFSLFERENLKNNSDYQKLFSEEKRQLIDLKDEEGLNISYCFKSEYGSCEPEEKKNQVHTRALHAEENAFLQIIKYGGRGIEGGMLFTTSSPCELCAKKAYQLGIKKIYYIEPYPGIATSNIIASGAKSNRPKLELFHGVVGRAFHNLYNPIIAYKDELTARINKENT